VVEDIDAAGIPDNARVTLEFLPEGRVAGTGGCNRYNAAFTLTGEGLSFGPAASTMMACAEALMNLEQRFHATLAAVDRFEIDPTGALILHAPEGRILARR
jgi:heat shock protein HslJ